ncbi:hypothetical protein D3C75_487360 [compost metagenome]
MKRLIRKSETTTLMSPPEIGEEIKLDTDPSFKGLDMDELSRPQNRDGAVLIDTKDNKVYISDPGETHADLQLKYFNIPLDSNETRLEIDSYVVTGIYLKNFLGNETIIVHDVNGAAEALEIIEQQKPGIVVYEEDFWEGTLLRLAKKE